MLMNAFLLVGAFLASPAIHNAGDGKPQAVKTALEMQKPEITKKRLSTVRIEATASIAATEKKFIGVNLVVHRDGAKDPIGLSVNLPDGPPEPGQRKSVRFTQTLLKGAYTGKMSMLYMDKDGESRTIELDMKPFKIE